MISTPEGLGGAERILTDLLAASAAEGWSQLVLNPFGLEPDSALRRACQAADLGVMFEAIPCGPFLGLPALRHRLAKRIAEFDPDVVHAHLFHAAVLVASLQGRLGAPTILTHHHGDHNVAEGRQLRTIVDRWAGRRFDHVVAISDAVRFFLVERFGYPPDLITLIRNGWSGTPVDPKPADPADPVIVCVARLREQKGHARLLRAFEIVRDAVPRAQLRLVGDGPLQKALERQVSEAGLGDDVEFMGDVENVWPVLAAGTVLVLPSNYEPLGIAVMEGMAAGLPVVASNVGGIPELVGDAGILVGTEDHEELAAALIRVVGDEGWRRHASESGRERAAQMRVEAMSARYLALYCSAISAP